MSFTRIKVIFIVLAALFSLSIRPAFAELSVVYPPTVYSGSKTNIKNVIEFFWSPSCPFCAMAFKNSIGPLMLKNGESGSNLFILYILPRNENDVLLGELLMCVPQKNFADAVTGLLLKNARDGAITDRTALFSFLKHFGLEKKTIAECENENARATLRKLNTDARELRKVKNTPGIVINGALKEEVLFLWQIEELIK
jgi:protein-disulfide isomerase